MNFLSCIALLAVVLLAVQIKAAEKQCFDWDESLKSIKSDCNRCQEKHTDVNDRKDCFFQTETYVKNGKIDNDKFVELSVEGFLGDEKTKEAIKNGVRECMKKDPKTSVENIETGDCIHDAIIKHCPEAKEKLKIESDEIHKCFDMKTRN